MEAFYNLGSLKWYSDTSIFILQEENKHMLTSTVLGMSDIHTFLFNLEALFSFLFPFLDEEIMLRAIM